MSIDLDDIIPLSIASLIFFLYVIFFIRKIRKNKESSVEWKKRLDPKASFLAKENEGDLTLLKTDVSPDTYFKSKLPKIEGLKEWIQHAGLEISPLVFVIGSAFVGAVVAVIFLVVFRTNYLIALLVGTVAAFMIPWIFIVFLAKRRRSAFLEEFPIALDMIRRALRVGHSTDRALTMVADQTTGPVGEAFRAINEKMQLGESMETALAEVSNRLGIEEFRMLAIVLVLQRETGGSLAEVTENFANIIRSRENLRKKVKALSAEVRVTAMILTALPIFIFTAIYATNPVYFNPLFYTERGNTLLLIGSAMLFSGVGIIIKMAYKEFY